MSTEQERQKVAYEAHLRLIRESIAAGWRKIGDHEHPEMTRNLYGSYNMANPQWSTYTLNYPRTGGGR